MAEDGQTINIASLARGLLRDLHGAVELEQGRPEGSGVERIKVLAKEVRVQRDEGLAEPQARYQKRTENAQALLTQRRNRIEAYALRQRQAVQPDPGKFIYAGRVVDQANGNGLPNVNVRLKGAGAGEGILAHTDALGYFRIERTTADLEGVGDDQRVANIEVLDDAGNIAFEAPGVGAEVGKAEFVAAEIDGGKVVESRKLATEVNDAVGERLKELDRRVRVLTPREDVRLKPPVLRVTPVQPSPGGAVTPAPGRDVVTPTPGDVVQPTPQGGGQPRKPKPPAPQPRARLAIKELQSVKPEQLEKLNARGFTDAEEIAAMNPNDLASLLDISANRAKTIVKEARKLTNE